MARRSKKEAEGDSHTEENDMEDDEDDREEEDDTREDDVDHDLVYGVSEENNAGREGDNDGEGDGDVEADRDDNEIDELDRDNEADHDGHDVDEEREPIEVLPLDPEVVKEDKVKEIATYFINCKGGSYVAAKTLVKQVLDMIYDKERDERAALARAASKRKRTPEDSEIRSDAKKERIHGEGDEEVDPSEYASLDYLPIESFMADAVEEDLEKRLCLVLLIPNEAALVGHIIGRGGVTVKEAKSRCGADIRVESDKFLAPGTPDRRIAVRGSVKTISYAAQYVLQLVKDKVDGPDAGKNTKDTLKFVVPDQSAGRLIGQKWAHMRELEQASKTRLQVLGKTQLPSQNTGRVIQAQGTFEAVCHAFYLCAKTVVEKVDFPEVWQTGDPTKDPSGRRDPERSRGERPPPIERRGDDRDPRNPNRPYVNERERPGRFAEGPPPSRFSGPPPQPPFGAPAVDPMIGAQRLGPFGPTGGPPPGAPSFRGFDEFAGGGQSGFSSGGPPPAIKASQTKTEIEIPETSVGFVFGRKGCQIREIRQRSSAAIDSTKKDDGADHRILTVSGSLSAVKMAVDMINDLVLEWGRREREQQFQQRR